MLCFVPKKKLPKKYRDWCREFIHRPPAAKHSHPPRSQTIDWLDKGEIQNVSLLWLEFLWHFTSIFSSDIWRHLRIMKFSKVACSCLFRKLETFSANILNIYCEHVYCKNVTRAYPRANPCSNSGETKEVLNFTMEKISQRWEPLMPLFWWKENGKGGGSLVCETLHSL